MTLRSSCKPVIVAIVLTLAGAGCTTIIRSSAGPGGAVGNAASELVGDATLSDNGRYVAFWSEASNLVPGDTNGVADVFRHDNVTGETVRVSVDGAGHQLSTASGGGGMSGDGHHVLFTTDAALDPGDTNGAIDVYVRSVDTGTTEWVSVKPDGTPVIGGFQYQSLGRSSISDDGRYVLVTDSLPGQGHVYLRDRVTKTTTLLDSTASDAMLTGDGKWVLVSGLCTGGPCGHTAILAATDGSSSEFLSEGCSFQPFAVSADGRYTIGDRSGAYPTFECPGANGLVRWDRVAKEAVAIPVASWNPAGLAISNDGRFVTTLDLDGHSSVIDLRSGVRQVVDTSDPNARGVRLTISGSGRYVAIRSPNALTTDDTNGVDDVYTRYSLTPAVTEVNPATVTRGAHLTVRVLGQAFVPGLTVEISGGGITVDDVTLVNPGRIDVDVTVAPDATTGARDVVVTNTGPLGGAKGWCSACLTVS
jgi:hypothetical protein